MKTSPHNGKTIKCVYFIYICSLNIILGEFLELGLGYYIRLIVKNDTR